MSIVFDEVLPTKQGVSVVSTAEQPRRPCDWAHRARGAEQRRENEQNTKLNNYEVWLSLVERYVRDVEVASSNLVTSTKRTRHPFGMPCSFGKAD